jgi:hypothetical protein
VAQDTSGSTLHSRCKALSSILNATQEKKNKKYAIYFLLISLKYPVPEVHHNKREHLLYRIHFKARHGGSNL